MDKRIKLFSSDSEKNTKRIEDAADAAYVVGGTGAAAGLGALGRVGLKKVAGVTSRAGQKMLIKETKKDASGKIKTLVMEDLDSTKYKLGNKVDEVGKKVEKALGTKTGKIVAVAVPAGIAAATTISRTRKIRKVRRKSSEEEK